MAENQCLFDERNYSVRKNSKAGADYGTCAVYGIERISTQTPKPSLVYGSRFKNNHEGANIENESVAFDVVFRGKADVPLGCNCLRLTQSGHFDAAPTSNSITAGFRFIVAAKSFTYVQQHFPRGRMITSAQS